MTRLHGETHESIGRNDPCHCGSGKKFKKCCEKNVAQEQLMQEQNTALQKVLQAFFKNHPRPSEQKELLAWKDKTENLLVPLYGEEKSGGIIGDTFFFSEQVDVWNDFIKQQVAREERTQIQRVLSSWIDPVFLIGEILSITNYRAEMRDLLSEKVYEIDVNESFPVDNGNLALGFYLPDARMNDRFLMTLNSITVTVETKTETIGKLKDMYSTSETTSSQEFYRRNLIPIYQMFSSGIRSRHEVSEDVLETVRSLELFMIEHDLKSDELIETFFHHIEPLPSVPEAAIAGAIQFSIEQNLLQFGWSLQQLAEQFEVEQEAIQDFADTLRIFYDEVIAGQEIEAAYAFEVGTNPKTNELQNWQLFMHLKNAAITSESALKRQMEYYHAKPYEPKSDAEKAQLTAYELYAMNRDDRDSDRIKAIQQLAPQLTDGFLLSAEAETDFMEKEALLKEAIRHGQAYYEKEMDIPWLYIANRPYLRAIFLLGVHYWAQREHQQAFAEFQKLLQLNPGDHQGARYLAISSLIVLGKFEEAESLIAHYEDAYADNAFYSWFKWLIQREQDLHSRATQELYEEAVEQNPYVKKYVERRLDVLPYPLSAIITPRSPEEARLIWSFLAPALMKN